jgi:hypothetical protein
MHHHRVKAKVQRRRAGIAMPLQNRLALAVERRVDKARQAVLLPAMFQQGVQPLMPRGGRIDRLHAHGAVLMQHAGKVPLPILAH